MLLLPHLVKACIVRDVEPLYNKGSLFMYLTKNLILDLLIRKRLKSN